LAASAAQTGQEQLAQSIRDARQEAVRTSEQLKATLASVTALTKQDKGDLRPAYETFCAQVANTESAASKTGTRLKWMTNDGEKYFQGWQITINGISNESLRKKAQKRLDTAKASYDKVEKSLQEASDKFKPFLADLGDIKKALAADLTPGGVKAVKGSVRSANWDHGSVNRSINSAIKEMDKMEKALSSEAT